MLDEIKNATAGIARPARGRCALHILFLHGSFITSYKVPNPTAKCAMTFLYRGIVIFIFKK